jgi:hypothetical protein
MTETASVFETFVLRISGSEKVQLSIPVLHQPLSRTFTESFNDTVLYGSNTSNVKKLKK